LARDDCPTAKRETAECGSHSDLSLRSAGIGGPLVKVYSASRT
jgi:hypothetical protein